MVTLDVSLRALRYPISKSFVISREAVRVLMILITETKSGIFNNIVGNAACGISTMVSVAEVGGKYVKKNGPPTTTYCYLHTPPPLTTSVKKK